MAVDVGELLGLVPTFRNVALVPGDVNAVLEGVVSPRGIRARGGIIAVGQVARYHDFAVGVRSAHVRAHIRPRGVRLYDASLAEASSDVNGEPGSDVSGERGEFVFYGHRRRRFGGIQESLQAIYG